MRNFVVTTPKSEMLNAAREAEACRQAGGGFYFRVFRNCRPDGLDRGSKIFYVEDGYVRGFAVISDITRRNFTCEVTGQPSGFGWYAIMPADSWRWIKPIPMKGFQGWRYWGGVFEVIGAWLDPKPELDGRLQ